MLGAKDKIDDLNSWLSFSFKCLAHFEFLSVPFSCSFHCNRALHSFSYIICPVWTYSSVYYTTVMTYFVFIIE